MTNNILIVCFENLATCKWKWFEVTDCDKFIYELSELVQNKDYEMVDIEGKSSLYNALRYKSLDELGYIGEWIYKSEIDIDVLTEVIEFGHTVEESLQKIDNNEVTIYNDCYDMESVAREWFEQLGERPTMDQLERYLDESEIHHYLSCSGYFSEDIYCQADEIFQDLKNGRIYDWNNQYVGMSFDEIEESIESHYDYNYQVECFIDNIESEFLLNFFDYKAFGRDMEIEGNFSYMGKGVYIQIWD